MVTSQVLPAKDRHCPGNSSKEPRKSLWALWVLDVDLLLICCEALSKSSSLSGLPFSHL